MRKLELGLRAIFRTRAHESSGVPGDVSRGRVDRARALIRKHWLASAGIGTAVLAVIAGVLAAGQTAPTHQRPAPVVAMVPRGVPRYYVALDVKGRVGEFPEPLAEATVRVTATGAVIARVFAPRPYVGFTAVTGAADDRTFVLLAHGRTNPFTGQIPERFFMLRIDPDAPSATARPRLTALPTADIPGGQNASELINGEEVATMALSPDGRSLAAILTVGGLNSLYVYNLTTGETRSWVWDGWGGDPGGLSNPISLSPGTPALSFTPDDRSVAFTFMYNHPNISFQLRLLHLGGQGNQVLPSSTPVVLNAPVNQWRQAVMTPDGKTVLMMVGFIGGTNSVLRFSTATGQAATINTLQPTPGYTAVGPLTVDTMLWTNDNGSTILVADAAPGHTLGVYSGKKYRPLPWPANAVGAAW
jgi:hypothetical protein